MSMPSEVDSDAAPVPPEESPPTDSRQCRPLTHSSRQRGASSRFLRVHNGSDFGRTATLRPSRIKKKTYTKRKPDLCILILRFPFFLSLPPSSLLPRCWRKHILAIYIMYAQSICYDLVLLENCCLSVLLLVAPLVASAKDSNVLLFNNQGPSSSFLVTNIVFFSK